MYGSTGLLEVGEEVSLLGRGTTESDDDDLNSQLCSLEYIAAVTVK
uniref:Uncharacterized protein n=1 Tax=Setaria digitata TaxID=48799 RepID=A0A915PQN5_9BILA